MASATEEKGRTSELVAITRLIEHGYTVLEPVTREAFDLGVIDPVMGKFLRLQVKSVYQRHDRDNALIIYATRNGGQRYSPDEIDLIVGVHGRDVYLVRHTGQAEFWATEKSASERWQLLPEGGMLASGVV